MSVSKLILAGLSTALLVPSGDAIADEALAESAGCLECHAVDEPFRAPAFQAIAIRYAGDPGARETLIEAVRNGTKGKWRDVGGQPMPPYWGLLSDPEIESLADWMLEQRGGQ